MKGKQMTKCVQKIDGFPYIPIDDDFMLMVCSAVRYALGRRTYIVYSTCQFVKSVLQFLDDKTIAIIKRDILDCQNLGDNCDRVAWWELFDLLGEELERRGND